MKYFPTGSGVPRELAFVGTPETFIEGDIAAWLRTHHVPEQRQRRRLFLRTAGNEVFSQLCR